jgi:hypothetical protein
MSALLHVRDNLTFLIHVTVVTRLKASCLQNSMIGRDSRIERGYECDVTGCLSDLPK